MRSVLHCALLLVQSCFVVTHLFGTCTLAHCCNFNCEYSTWQGTAASAALQLNTPLTEALQLQLDIDRHTVGDCQALLLSSFASQLAHCYYDSTTSILNDVHVGATPCVRQRPLSGSMMPQESLAQPVTCDSRGGLHKSSQHTLPHQSTVQCAAPNSVHPLVLSGAMENSPNMQPVGKNNSHNTCAGKGTCICVGV